MEISAENKSLEAEDIQGAAVSAEDTFVMPATPGQERFWLLHRVHPGSHALNMPIALTCHGNFDFEAASAALTELVKRHESLRTTFEVVNGRLSQVIGPGFRVELPIVDLRDLPAAERREKAAALIQSEARISVDMEKGPLFVARVLRIAADENILLLTIHHSVCDGWSNGIMLRDFSALYDGIVRGIASDLPELPIQFGDYAVWLDEWRKGTEHAECLDYWRKTLGGKFARLHIPHDFAEESEEHVGEIETLLMDPKQVERAKDYCATRGVTLYMLLFSAYVVTLQRITGENDIVVGTPHANRAQETENLIGPFSNPQVLRIKLEDACTAESVIERVREWVVGAVAHQKLPFEDLNEDEFFSRDENQLLLQVYFIYQKAFMRVQKTPSLEITPLRSVSPGTMFELLLSIVERDEGPRLQLEYNTGLFRASTMKKVLNLYVRALDDLMAGGVLRLESPLAKSTGIAGGEHSEAAKQGGSREELAGNGSAGGLSHFTAEERPNEDYVAPRDPLELQIAGIWEMALGIKNISVHHKFFDLGGRSLAAMRMISKINKTYALDFGLATLFSGNTIALLADLVRKRLSTESGTSLIPMQPKGSAAPLFIIHGAGGNIIRFYQLAMLVGTDHPIYGVQAQSLLAGQPALLHLEDQAAYYLAEIRQRQPKGPYFFLGYSYGGTIAFEIAHRLQEMGEKVELLGMLDSRQRDCMVTTRKKDSVRLRLDRRMERLVGNMSQLSAREMVEYLWQKMFTRSLRHIYSLAFALGYRSVPNFMKSTDEISWVAAMHYRPRVWPGQITLFRTAIQSEPRLPFDLGWSPLAKGGVEVFELPGDHDSVFRESNIQVLATKLRLRLGRSDAAPKAPGSSDVCTVERGVA